MKRIFCTLPLLFMLNACGSDSDNTDLEISQHLWIDDSYQNDSPVYQHIQAGRISAFQYHEAYDCHSNIFEFELIRLTNSIIEGNGIVMNYLIEADSLTIENNPPLTKAQLTPQELISCADASLLGDINITLDFVNLPNSIEVMDTSQENWLAEFFTGIYFDVDESEDISEGDLRVELNQSIDANSNEQTINLSDLNAQLWAMSSSSGSYRITTLSYDKIGNRLTLRFPRAMHKALASIDTGVQAHVLTDAYSPDFFRQSDRFPDSGWISIANFSNSRDSSGDVAGNVSSEQIITDLTDISIQITQ